MQGLWPAWQANRGSEEQSGVAYAPVIKAVKESPVLHAAPVTTAVNNGPVFHAAPVITAVKDSPVVHAAPTIEEYADHEGWRIVFFRK